jgi:hypothetical protein
MNLLLNKKKRRGAWRKYDLDYRIVVVVDHHQGAFHYDAVRVLYVDVFEAVNNMATSSDVKKLCLCPSDLNAFIMSRVIRTVTSSLLKPDQ